MIVLIGLAWFDQNQLNSTYIGPCQHGATAELFPVIGPNRLA